MHGTNALRTALAVVLVSGCAAAPPTPPESTRVYADKLDPTAPPIAVQRTSVDELARAEEEKTAPPEVPETIAPAPVESTPEVPAAAAETSKTPAPKEKPGTKPTTVSPQAVTKPEAPTPEKTPAATPAPAPAAPTPKK